MKKRPPSILHLARLWRPTPEMVAKEVLRTWTSTPNFSYRLLYDLVTKALQGALPYSQFEMAIRANEPRESVRRILLDVLPHLYAHFHTLNPAFVLPVEPRFYVVSNDLIIPFAPPLVFGDQTGSVLPWFLFWQTNPLTKDQIALASTLAIEIIEQDPDLADTDFSLHDFGIAHGEKDRQLKITRRNALPTVSDSIRNEMLEIFVVGYEMATEQYPALKASLAERRHHTTDSRKKPAQPPADLFDGINDDPK